MTTNSLAHFPLRSGVSVSVPWNWVGSVIALNNRIRGMWHHVDYAMLIGSVERTTERPAWRGSMDPAELLGDSSIDLPALAGNLSEEALWFQVGQLHLMPRELEGSCGHPPTQTVNSWANECCCFKQLSFGHGLWFSKNNWNLCSFWIKASISGLRWQWGLASVWCLCEFYHKHCQQNKSSDTQNGGKIAMSSHAKFTETLWLWSALLTRMVMTAGFSRKPDSDWLALFICH